MLKPKGKPYRPSARRQSIERLETRRIRVNLIPARGLNAAVVTMAGPWTAKDWRQRNLFLHEAIELRDRLNKLLPPEDYPIAGEVT